MHKVVQVWYEESQTVKMQGKREDVQPWLRKGFSVQSENYGYWILYKSARACIKLENGQVLNFKDEICAFYGRQRISESLVARFQTDLSDGLVKIEERPYGGFCIEKC